jgi:HSP20 family protein
MKDDSMDVFRQMDAMIAQMVAEMTRGMVSGLSPHPMGYRIIIQGSDAPPEAPQDSITTSPGAQDPAPEVHRVADEVKVVAGLPGVDKDSIRLDVRDGVIVIMADGNGQHYRTSADLPPVDTGSMRSSFKNGVLEVTFAALNEPSGEEQQKS